MKTIDITVSGDPTTAKSAIEATFFSRGFAVTWTDSWSGIVEKGSKVRQAVAGAFSPYYKIGFAIMSGSPGQYTLRVQQLTSGAGGGLINVSRTKKLFLAVTTELTQALATTGTVISSTES
jgi:hypothetical protein